MDEKISDLQQLRIHELRDLARKMGVNAPTSKKKEEIIDEIIKIMNGESVPFSTITKKGRPARSNSENFDVVDFILPNQSEIQSFNLNSEYENSQERLKFMVNMNYADYNNEISTKINEREGIVEIKPEGFGVLHVSGYFSSLKDVFINQIMVKQNKLKSGLKIRVKSRKIKENYPEIVHEILEIESSSNKNFDDQKSISLGGDYKLNCGGFSGFSLGGRYYVKPSYDSYKETYDIALEIQKNYPDLVVESLYLNAMLDKLPMETVVPVNFIEFCKSDEDVICGTNLYFDRLKRQAESGRDVVCVINEISQYAKSNNNIYLKSGKVGEISNRTGFLTKALLSTAKNTNYGSITLIAVDALRLPTGIYDLFKYDILPIFHNAVE